MSYPMTHLRWKEVLDRRDPAVLPFLNLYREAGLLPEQGSPSWSRVRKGRLEIDRERR